MVLKNLNLFVVHGIPSNVDDYLYTQVLSSRLMPTTAVRDAATMQSARKFCEDFLEANGLTLILNILHKDAMHPDVDYHTRQGCYVLSLQLLRQVST